MIRPIVAGLIVVPWLLAAPPSLAQAAPCQYILGFKTLHDMDPTDIGDCTDNQAFAANGDAQQHSAKGLLAWRKADNWTAFTNGYWTWINGPNGLAKRLNSQRYSWEANPNNLPLADGGSAQPAPSTPVAQQTATLDPAWASAEAAKFANIGGQQFQFSFRLSDLPKETDPTLAAYEADVTLYMTLSDKGNSVRLTWLRMPTAPKQAFANTLLQDAKAQWPGKKIVVHVDGVGFYTPEISTDDKWTYQGDTYDVDQRGFYTVYEYAKVSYYPATGDDVEAL